MCFRPLNGFLEACLHLAVMLFLRRRVGYVFMDYEFAHFCLITRLESLPIPKFVKRRELQY